jgi:hypothetical protein
MDIELSVEQTEELKQNGFIILNNNIVVIYNKNDKTYFVSQIINKAWTLRLNK